jgi:hypothetical protein
MGEGAETQILPCTLRAPLKWEDAHTAYVIRATWDITRK